MKNIRQLTDVEIEVLQTLEKYYKLNHKHGEELILADFIWETKEESKAFCNLITMARELEEELNAEEEVDNKYYTNVLMWFWYKYKQQLYEEMCYRK